jgi:hypothetical protein
MSDALILAIGVTLGGLIAVAVIWWLATHPEFWWPRR